MRRKNKEKPKFINPCINVCTIDNDTNMCIGCKRTTKEISDWFWMNDEQKIEIMKTLETRT